MLRRWLSIIAAISLLTALGAVLPGAARANHALTPVATQHFTGAGWAAWRVSVQPGGGWASLTVDARAPGASGLGVGTFLLGDDGTEFGLANVHTGGDRRVHVGGPDGTIVDSRSGGSSDSNRMSITAPLGEGSYVFVAMAAHDDAEQIEADVTLSTEGPVEVVGATSGEEAFVHREQDFDGTLNASAAYDNYTVKAILGGAREIPAAGRMFAMFASWPGNQVLKMGYDGPAGSRDGASFYAIVGGSPGSYRFRIDQALGGYCCVLFPPVFPGGTVLLAGADVTLPPVLDSLLATGMTLTVEGHGANRALVARLSQLDDPASGVPGRTIDFHADGTSVGSATTNQDGVATLLLPPRYRGGKHTFDARFEGDDQYGSSSARIDT